MVFFHGEKGNESGRKRCEEGRRDVSWGGGHVPDKIRSRGGEGAIVDELR